MNIKKLLDAGKDAISRNPQLKLTHDEMNKVLKLNKGNIFHFAVDLYYIGFALGFALGKRHERGELKNERL